MIYREAYEKEVRGIIIERKRMVENWNLPLFTTKEGQELIHRIIEGAVKSNK